jgi:hypothetical protein
MPALTLLRQSKLQLGHFLARANTNIEADKLEKVQHLPQAPSSQALMPALKLIRSGMSLCGGISASSKQPLGHFLARAYTNIEADKLGDFSRTRLCQH